MTCRFANPKFIKSANDTIFIASDYNSIVKYLIREDSISLIEEIILKIGGSNKRLSYDSKWLILWGTERTRWRLQIRNVYNFASTASTKYDRTFINFGLYESI
jgi:hypothetical protein